MLMPQGQSVLNFWGGGRELFSSFSKEMKNMKANGVGSEVLTSTAVTEHLNNS